MVDTNNASGTRLALNHQTSGAGAAVSAAQRVLSNGVCDVDLCTRRIASALATAAIPLCIGCLLLGNPIGAGASGLALLLALALRTYAKKCRRLEGERRAVEDLEAACGAVKSELLESKQEHNRLKVTHRRMEETLVHLSQGIELETGLVARHEELIRREENAAEAERLLLREQTAILARQEAVAERLDHAQRAIMSGLLKRQEQRRLVSGLQQDLLDRQRQLVAQKVSNVADCR